LVSYISYYHMRCVLYVQMYSAHSITNLFIFAGGHILLDTSYARLDISLSELD